MYILEKYNNDNPNSYTDRNHEKRQNLSPIVVKLRIFHPYRQRIFSFQISVIFKFSCDFCQCRGITLWGKGNGFRVILNDGCGKVILFIRRMCFNEKRFFLNNVSIIF